MTITTNTTAAATTRRAHYPTGMVIRALSRLGKRWTDEANRSGHHPDSGDAAYRLALALEQGKRLNAWQWNHLRSFLACCSGLDVQEERRLMELYQGVKDGNVTQGPDGLLRFNR